MRSKIIMAFVVVPINEYLININQVNIYAKETFLNTNNTLKKVTAMYD